MSEGVESDPKNVRRDLDLLLSRIARELLAALQKDSPEMQEHSEDGKGSAGPA